MTERIYGFFGPNDFLSNFHPSPIVLEGIRYPTVEHAFQAFKTLDVTKRREIAMLRSPGAAKRAGRRLALRPDWEQVKTGVMLACLREKYRIGVFGALLLETGESELIEANTWGDRVWGVDRATGTGENRLGRLLMQVRGELAGAAIRV